MQVGPKRSYLLTHSMISGVVSETLRFRLDMRIVLPHLSHSTCVLTRYDWIRSRIHIQETWIGKILTWILPDIRQPASSAIQRMPALSWVNNCGGQWLSKQPAR